MTPQEIAKSIADELREHPERWTQFATARDSAGRAVGYDSPTATCWCIAGLAWKRHPLGHASFALEEMSSKAIRVAQIPSVVGFNDTDGRTVQEIIALCDKLAGAQS